MAHNNAYRYRQKISTTVSPDTFRVVLALCEPDRKGHFLDEAIHAYMTACYIFNAPGHGALMMREQGSFYHFVDMNEEQQSPDFRSMIESLIWLKNTYPDSNTINIQEDSGGKLF